MSVICRKSILLVCSLLLAGFLPVRGQSTAQLLFDRANDSLQTGNYREALSVYHSLEKEDKVSGGLFLNMGISCIQVDSLGKAKYYFLKARQYEDTRRQAIKGLEYTESRFSRQSALLPKLPWDKTVDWLRLHVGASSILGIGIILLNIGVIGYVATWFIAPFQKLLKYTGLSLAGVGFLFVLTGFYVQYVDQRYSDAVMVDKQSNVLEKPSSEASIISQAYEGYSFTIDHYKSEEHPGWSYVRMSNGLYGWIPNEKIMVL